MYLKFLSIVSVELLNFSSKARKKIAFTFIFLLSRLKIS